MRVSYESNRSRSGSGRFARAARPRRSVCELTAIVLMSWFGTIGLTDAASADVLLRAAGPIKLAQRHGARDRPPPAPSSRPPQGGFALVGGNANLDVGVLFSPDHTIQYTIAGRVPCGGGGSSLDGAFAFRAPGHWSGHSFSGSYGTAGYRTTTISGTFTSSYTMSGRLSVSATYTNSFFSVHCGTKAHFTGQCGRGCQQNELTGDELAAPQATLFGSKVWEATLHNPIATAKSYTWEMKPSSASGWTTLGTTKSRFYKITYRLAGNFELRVFFNGASAGGSPPRRLVSPVRPVEVRFPTWNEIATNQAVRAFTQEAWRITLRLATQMWRQEVGFWITLDTCSRTYDHLPLIKGPIVPSNRDGEVTLGHRPADTTTKPDPVTGCATYPVASFHTHTPTRYRTIPNLRQVGPSQADEDADKHDQVPGIVFDYRANPPKGNTIPNGYPKNEPALRYRSGLPLRPTP